MRARAILACALAALGITACIIGPKQDDPAEARAQDSAPSDDLGFTDETTGAVDTGLAPPAPDAGAALDASPPKGDAMPDGDAEAGCGDGGFPITALRYDAAKKCWGESVFFECQAGPDGGAAFTCFVQISTGGVFLASSTQIPSGSDYRACKAGEGAPSGDRCK